MNTYSLVAQALFRAVPQINIALFGGNDSSEIESAMSTTIFVNSPVSVLATPTTNNLEIASTPTVGIPTTQVIVDIVQSSEDATSSEPLVDSAPPRITIDTVIAAVRPQEITEIHSKGITTASAVPCSSGVSSPAPLTST